MKQTFRQVAIYLQTHVTTIVYAIQGVGTLTSQIEHCLRIDVDQFQLSGR